MDNFVNLQAPENSEKLIVIQYFKDYYKVILNWNFYFAIFKVKIKIPFF